ncbi:PRTRC system ParB family protein [Paraburkholderia sp. MMS20-SJTR3]|uniref:PRTRC system ParB family protein n=1 Tax=Paraburkholderia sejongensis TaxID=2886946 RepID=A0ABS8K557_9BURK|nr:PRTRC system ParB family protein [Paraburkholderia sp. MMS20-SJTR3]MCC8397285.1 PRTRC system ParB family protein [Paraburkholderia sp. MMS20-SJTR3]
MQQQPTLSLKQITIAANPRTYFDAAEMEELTASVREKGVIQPVIVRPLDDGGFALVAGGRRYRAAMTAHGEDYEIPVVVREIDEVEAKQLAIIENIQRADMSPAEEAIAAAEQVGLCKGDRDEVARIFGWSRATLDKRLALMNCSASVLEALNTRQILLGHAELLAALPKETQDKLVPVIIKESKPVPELKKTIEQVACSLSAAIFDKTDCANCAHNSSTQGEMFGESIATGNCTNRTCFNEKTEKQLEAVAANLRDDFPVVRIVRAGDNHTRIQLAVEGAKGVGEEQAKACHACQNYGAAVSGLPDSIGKVYKGQCFDTVCNMKMVAKRLQAEKAAAQPKPEAKGGGTGAAKPAAKASGAAHSTTGNPPATVVAESDRIKTYRVALWRKALRSEVGRNAVLAQRYLVSLALAGQARCVDDSTMKGIWEKLTEEKIAVSDVAKAATSVAAADDAKLALAVTGVTIAAIQGLDIHHLTSLCRHHRLDLNQHWKLCKEFLELITKSEMMVVADELGIRAALGDEFKKVFSKSKAEVIDALLNVKGFDYNGKVPKVLKY